MTTAHPAGVIHDLGYRSYQGPRLGRAAIVRALCWHSLRSAFGLGRGARAKLVPWAMLILLAAPALVNAIIVARAPGHQRAIGYDSYLFQLRVLVMLVFVAVQAPELVSRDLRHHVLPLYFSRPLHRRDYPLAKYAAFTASCLILTEVPLLLLYLGTVVSASRPGQVWDETRALVPGLAFAAAWAVLLAAIGLVLACLASRRAYATGAVAVTLVISWTLAGLLGGRAGALLSPFTVLQGITQWLTGQPLGGFGPAYAVMFAALLAASLAGLAARYRTVGES